MKGSINVKSKKDRGTRVEINFELALGEPEQMNKTKNEPNSKSIAHAKVLLVVDNPFKRIVVRNTLERLNCQATEAEDGSSALTLLSAQNYDIILMDLQMPIMDGFETTNAIRNTLGVKTPIIALTANAFKSDLEHCVEAGMNGYITKPFEEEKLIDLISRHLSNGPLTESSSGTTAQKIYDLSKLSGPAFSDRSQLEKMISLFNEQITKSLEQINRAIKTADWDTLHHVIHRIKPGILMMGIESLRQDLLFVEDSAKNKRNLLLTKERLPVIVGTLEKAVARLNLELTGAA